MSMINNKFKLNPVQILAIGFVILIFVGGLLLSLPMSSASGESTNFLDALFTSTTASCVTGLVVKDTGTYWSTSGQVIILILIEIGGLGFMSFATFIAMLFGKKITLKNRLVMQEAMNTLSIQGLVKMLRYVMGITFSIQILGAFILSTQFVPEFGLKKGIFYSIFHSVSFFCNAGIDLIGNFESLTRYYNKPVVLLTVSSLIVIGGLGFTVLHEIYNFKGVKRLSSHTKLVFLITAALIILGTISIFALEYTNVNTIGNMNLKDKIVNSILASITPRTAGVNSIPIDDMRTASKFFTIILMFIGGSPGSTAGGLKTTTFGVIILTVICVIKGKEDTELFGRRFPKELVYKAFSLLFIGMTLVIVVTMILTITEPNESLTSLLYEATSAFGTVGLTTGLTQRLSSMGKGIIIIMMYLGRVGPLTVALALTKRRKRTLYKYPEAKILIG
ncbi:Trk family potassium uptake protein [Clostridium botulinum]|nr:Trk family potassium uptake protein [Clostridium botulinum]NFI64240.1 Trk family potassium uptake protein [Clostridium botulinum]NFJ44519.1 Trk family potassium uptake protein [Clostridium botulinum]NFJ48218.1 Trk family potassium uptake protein [Clostridium botulinum]NFK27032.1 Trk family potassium uptake protein [Clostridium botulinum]